MNVKPIGTVSVRGPSVGSTPSQYIEKLLIWCGSPDGGNDSREGLSYRHEFGRAQIECMGNWGLITAEEQRAYISALNAVVKVLPEWRRKEQIAQDILRRALR